LTSGIGRCADNSRSKHTTADRPEYAGAGPGHAFKKSATIDTVVFLFMVVRDEV
jgi:hypothetical protein